MDRRWHAQRARTCRCRASWSAAWSTRGPASPSTCDDADGRASYSWLMAVEREIKIGVPTDFVLPDLNGADGLRAVERGVHVLSTTYWATDSLELMKIRRGLRYRTTDGGERIWTCRAITLRDMLDRVMY